MMVVMTIAHGYALLEDEDCERTAQLVDTTVHGNNQCWHRKHDLI